MAPPENTPSQREGSTPPIPEEDDEMAVDSRPRNSDGNPGGEPRQAAKRARTSIGGDSTVSKTVIPSRDSSPLRKTAPQSDWAHDFTPLAPMPEAVRDWLKERADKVPYNPAYDEAIYARIPAGRHANPHLWQTQREPRPEPPLDGHQAFTPGPFPFIQINYWKHLGNLQPAQRKMLEEDLGRWLAIVPHGGGRAINEHAHELCKVLEEFFWTLRFAGYSGESIKVSVMPADPRSVAGPNGTNDFAPPWAFFVDLIHDDKGILRNYVLDHQHFAIDRTLSFSIHGLDSKLPRSWKVAILVSPMMTLPGASHRDVVAARTELRQAIIDKLGKNDDFCALIAQLAANNIGHTGNRDQVFKTVTDTYHLELTTVDCDDGTPTPAFVLLARPIVDSRLEIEALKHAMIVALCGRKSQRDDDHFYVGTRKVRVVDDSKLHPPFFVDCKLCKSELHRTPDCPLPKSRGWRGVQPKDLGFPTEVEKPKAAAQPRALLEGVFDRLSGGQRGTGRGRGRGNEKRGNGRGGQNTGSRGRSSSRR